MHVTYRCPNCEQMNRSETLSGDQAVLSCSACQWERPVSAEKLSHACPQECLVCGNLDLWRQKDFPPLLGVACVALGAILSGIAVYFYWPFTAMAILMAFGALDMILYLVMPDVMVCYRCQSRHGGVDTSSAQDFNLELSERYRQEAIRLKQASPSN
jgi:predicted RNA-binding Zn-ribbon protein involved in translation (DUF1610 family)